MNTAQDTLADAIMAVVNTTPLGWGACHQLRFNVDSRYAVAMAVVFSDKERLTQALGQRLGVATYVESMGVPAVPAEGRYAFKDGTFPLPDEEKPTFDQWSPAQLATWQGLTQEIAALGEDGPARGTPHYYDFRLPFAGGYSDVRLVILTEHREHADLVAMRMLNPHPSEGLARADRPVPVYPGPRLDSMTVRH
ncbi:hypothetical protein [Paraburkholderia youngii]|uniref:hypothetical protein n=1 Tax=Paraburkholderia youngii TaxID=2782701 RepID=UPI003D254C6A